MTSVMVLYRQIIVWEMIQSNSKFAGRFVNEETPEIRDSCTYSSREADTVRCKKLKWFRTCDERCQEKKQQLLVNALGPSAVSSSYRFRDQIDTSILTANIFGNRIFIKSFRFSVDMQRSFRSCPETLSAQRTDMESTAKEQSCSSTNSASFLLARAAITWYLEQTVQSCIDWPLDRGQLHSSIFQKIHLYESFLN